MITSQNDTTPKLTGWQLYDNLCLITSQNDTAPKLGCHLKSKSRGLITSQNDTAPKPPSAAILPPLTTVHNDVFNHSKKSNYCKYTGKT